MLGGFELMAMTMKHRYGQDKSAIMTRMKKIEGQAKGIQQMIEEDRYCIDIVQQLSALCAAADEVALLILEDHIEGCVTDAIREHHGESHIKELMNTIRKAMKR
jgi:DNA-binding FrmR family transcriptional regulator